MQPGIGIELTEHDSFVELRSQTEDRGARFRGTPRVEWWAVKDSTLGPADQEAGCRHDAESLGCAKSATARTLAARLIAPSRSTFNPVRHR
jgi:hypothetical protein